MDRKKHIPPFEVPKDYFRDFEERLFLKIAEEDFPKTSGFRVPEAYFKNLDQVILSKLRTREEPKIIPLTPHKIVAFASAIAACLVIAISVLKFSNQDTQIDIETVNLSLIDNYIEDGNLDMDLYDVTNYLRTLDDAELFLNSFMISDEEIERYLFESFEEDNLLYGSTD